MNVFAKFGEIPSMILEVIKETKRYGQTVCGGYNKIRTHSRFNGWPTFIPARLKKIK